MNRGAEMKLIGGFLLVGIVLVTYLVSSSVGSGRAAQQPFMGPGPDATVDPALLLDSRGHVRGARNAPFKLVEFADLQCPNSRYARELTRKYMKFAKGNLCVVAYHFQAVPRHVHEELLASAAEAAGAQGRFWPMYDKLMDRLDRFDGVDEPTARTEILRAAKELKLDTAAFVKTMDAPETRGIYERNAGMAARLRIKDTPGYFLVTPQGPPIRLNNVGMMLEWMEDPAKFPYAPPPAERSPRLQAPTRRRRAGG